MKVRPFGSTQLRDRRYFCVGVAVSCPKGVECRRVGVSVRGGRRVADRGLSNLPLAFVAQTKPNFQALWPPSRRSRTLCAVAFISRLDNLLKEFVGTAVGKMLPPRSNTGLTTSTFPWASRQANIPWLFSTALFRATVGEIDHPTP